MPKQEMLIVDDRPENLIALENVLDGIDCELIRACNGNDALKLALRHDFSLAILDVQMPEMDGYELAQLLRSDRKACKIPIIFLSAVYSDYTHIFKGYKSGAVDFLTKPYEPDILREKVKVFLGLDKNRRHLEGVAASRTAELETLNERLESELKDKKKADERNKLSTQVFENVAESIIVSDPKGNIIYINSACTSISGYSGEELLGKTPAILRSNHHDNDFYKQMWHSLLSTGQWQGEVWNRRKSGEVYPQWLNISSIKDDSGELSHYVALGRDITELKRAEKKIFHQAYHDPLTGLPNRLLFEDRLKQSVSRAGRSEKKLAVMFLDLDHFKNLNDSLGHQTGDLFLKQVADQFVNCLRTEDTVSRLGGDEFTVILEGIESKEDASTVAQKLIDIFSTPFDVEGNEIYLGVSIGLSLFPTDSDDVETLIKYADLAMYHAKASDRNNYQFFKTDLESQVVEQVSMEKHLRKGMVNKEFQAYYQPIINPVHGNITGMEALMRWDRPGYGLVSPAIFIPIAEEKGLIVSMGEWILNHACEYVAALNKRRDKPLTLSVNLSARQFREKDLPKTVERILKESGLAPASLFLEITETTLMDNMELSVATMEKLRSMGIRLSLDDFGTGYSSLNYLKQFPLDVLKLDHTFVKDIPEDSDATKIAAAIISLAKGLGLQVIAEGVENSQQLMFLERHQCERVQGFLFSRPVPGDEFEQLLLKQMTAASK
ncbi:EAL domain-containing protein [Pseudomonadota bacterium]